MAWFQKRDPQILDAIERDINQFYAYVQNGYTLKAVAERGGFKGRGINLSVDLSTSAVTARFSADDFANLCHGRSHTIDAQNDDPPLFLAKPQAGAPASPAFDALQNVAPGSVALLKPTGDSMEALLVIDADELVEIERWLETIPATK